MKQSWISYDVLISCYRDICLFDVNNKIMQCNPNIKWCGSTFSTYFVLLFIYLLDTTTNVIVLKKSKRTCIESWSASGTRPDTRWATAPWFPNGTLQWCDCSDTSGRPCPASDQERTGVTSRCCPGTPCRELSPDEKLIMIARKILLWFHAALFCQLWMPNQFYVRDW